MIDVWFASVTVGNDDIAPWPNATPMSIKRAIPVEKEKKD